MSVFSSLQTLAEKYENARWPAKATDLGAFQAELVNAWPLLEAAVKALEYYAANDTWYGDTIGDTGKRARAALSSLTGEPR